jgi:hypothetical protein
MNCLIKNKAVKEDRMKLNRICTTGALAAGFVCLGLMFGSGAPAQVKNACSDDIAKFCKDVKPGHGAIMDCLEKNETQLTDACKDYEQKMGGARLERREMVRAQVRLRQACGEDLRQYCKDMKPDVGMSGCLTENESKLSPTCREALQTTKEEKK